jgi:multiple sugar transport system permease protein
MSISVNQNSLSADSGINRRGYFINKKSSFWNRNRDNIEGFLFITPELIFYLVFVVIPVIYGAWISLHNMDVVMVNVHFIGLQNFERIFGDANFWKTLKNTLTYTLISSPLSMALGLGVALLVNKPYRGMGIFRAIFYLPSVLSVSVIGLIWQRLYNPDFGVLASLFNAIGLKPLPWLMDPNLAMPAIVITSLWWGLGFPMLIFLAGLQDIPRELYESAKLDGAGGWNLFRYITIPGLHRQMLFVMVMTLISSFQVFGQVFVMTNGGPGGHTRTLIMYIYETSFTNWQLGYGSAMAYALFIIMFGLSLFQLRLMTSNTES